MTTPEFGSIALLNEKQAARLLAISFRTLQAWRRTGVGPSFIKLGRAVRYRQQDLLAWADGHRRAG
ncbi:helix-turn-helix transcriptional regulator [Bradyrhizobium sp. USDA 4516]